MGWATCHPHFYQKMPCKASPVAGWLYIGLPRQCVVHFCMIIFAQKIRAVRRSRSTCLLAGIIINSCCKGAMQKRFDDTWCVWFETWHSTCPTTQPGLKCWCFFHWGLLGAFGSTVLFGIRNFAEKLALGWTYMVYDLRGFDRTYLKMMYLRIQWWIMIIMILHHFPIIFPYFQWLSLSFYHFPMIFPSLPHVQTQPVARFGHNGPRGASRPGHCGVSLRHHGLGSGEGRRSTVGSGAIGLHWAQELGKFHQLLGSLENVWYSYRPYGSKHWENDG